MNKIKIHDNFIKNFATDFEKSSLKIYFTHFKQGILFIFSSKVIFLYVIGLAVYDVWVYIWMSLLLFPVFFAYTGTDALTSGLRTINWLTIMPLQIYMANISKRLANKTFPFVLIFHPVLLLISFLILLSFIPVENDFNIIGLSLVFLISVIINGTVWKILLVLRQRYTLDLIASDKRNSVYSLIPTLVAIIGIPILPIVGRIIEEFGLGGGILVSLIIAVVGSIITTSSFYFKRNASESVYQSD